LASGDSGKRPHGLSKKLSEDSEFLVGKTKHCRCGGGTIEVRCVISFSIASGPPPPAVMALAFAQWFRKKAKRGGVNQVSVGWGSGRLRLFPESVARRGGSKRLGGNTCAGPPDPEARRAFNVFQSEPLTPHARGGWGLCRQDMGNRKRGHMRRAGAGKTYFHRPFEPNQREKAWPLRFISFAPRTRPLGPARSG